MGDVYRASILASVNGVGCVNVMHWEEVSVGSNPNRLESLRDWLSDPTPGTNFAFWWQQCVANDTTLSCMKLQKVDPAPEGTMRHYFVSHSGAAGASPAPSNLCLVIRLYSDTATKRGRGRHFFAGLAKESLIGGNYTGVMTTPLGELANMFSGLGTAADGSVYRGSVYSPTDDVYRDCRIAHWDPIPRNHRSRNAVLCGV